MDGGGPQLWLFWVTPWAARVVAMYLLLMGVCGIVDVSLWIGVTAASAIWLVAAAPLNDDQWANPGRPQ